MLKKELLEKIVCDKTSEVSREFRILLNNEVLRDMEIALYVSEISGIDVELTSSSDKGKQEIRTEFWSRNPCKIDEMETYFKVFLRRSS
jgi:hypothetical protein